MPPAHTDRSAELQALLQERLLILDGAMGTMIQRHNLQEADYRGERFRDHARDLKGNNDLLLLTRPDIIRGIHADYLAAGADILETCTFNSNAPSQADYGLQALVYELNFAGARLAREVCDEFTARNPAKPRFVAGVRGPTSRTASGRPGGGASRSRSSASPWPSTSTRARSRSSAGTGSPRPGG